MGLIDKKIIINITNRTKKYYNDLGYNTENNKILINTIDLPKNSIIKIKVSCENCNCEKYIQYRNFLKSKKTYNKYYCHICCHIKSQKTYFKKHNIKFNLLTDENTKKRKKGKRRSDTLKREKTLERKKKTINKLLENKINNFIIKAKKIHGDKYDYSLIVYKTNKIKVQIKCNLCNNIFKQTPSNHVNHKQNCSYCFGKGIEYINNFEKYGKKVRKLTKNELLEKWNGYDYYDGEYIKINFKLKHTNNQYPNIDHKISIKYGFDNNLTPEFISDINNLCLTKRINNLKKGAKINIKI